MSKSAPKKKRIGFTADGKRVSFMAKVHRPKKAAKCELYSIGQTITRKTKKGRTVTFKRTKPHGKMRNLCWKIMKNRKTPKAK